MIGNADFVKWKHLAICLQSDCANCGNWQKAVNAALEYSQNTVLPKEVGERVLALLSDGDPITRNLAWDTFSFMMRPARDSVSAS